MNVLRRMDNLRRAWRWIRSNPDPSYKSYFWPLYQHFAVADERLLKDLSGRLRRGIYEPEPSCKVFLPKTSGILRPYSLLTVEDQIVYQAAVNIVAEKFQKKSTPLYASRVFGHLYAGKRSRWFYKKWTDGYRLFNTATKNAYTDGFIYTASFDLTACYDSLDHGVLKYFLRALGLDNELSQSLTDWLEVWTATEQGIYHHHGIPQGPLSSGLLSEVVLSHFDTASPSVNIKYFRYVDDIRLFARDELSLRKALIDLDLISKDIGLFPQSSKIGIHRIENIDNELKSISNPLESSVKRKVVDQTKVANRLKELSPRFQVINPTRFKYVLAHASPSSGLTSRIWRILENHPELYSSICRYLRRYNNLPKVPSTKLLQLIAANPLYQSVLAELVDVANGRMELALRKSLTKHLKHQWRFTKLLPDAKVSIGRFLLSEGALTSKQIEQACAHGGSWWVRAMLIDAVDYSTLPKCDAESTINKAVSSPNRSVATAIAWKGFVNGHMPTIPQSKWNTAADLLLHEVGMVARSVGFSCGISNALRKFDKSIAPMNWKGFLGSRYIHLERQCVEFVAASSISVTTFVNALDVWNDLLLDDLFGADKSLGSYTLGRIGTMLSAPTGRLATNYPSIYLLASEVHQRRGESNLSHPLNKRTGKPTKKIKYDFLFRAKKLVADAVDELHHKGHI